MIDSQLDRSFTLLRTRLLLLPRIVKRSLMIASDALGVIFCGALTFWICRDSLIEAPLAQSIILFGVVSVALVVVVNANFGLYRSVLRFMGTNLYLASLKSSIVTAGIVLALGLVAGQAATVSRFTLVFWALLLIFMCSSRFLARYILNHRKSHQTERVVIYGAGAAGVGVATTLQNGDQFTPIAFVDDSRQLWGQVVGGIEVKPARQIKQIINEQSVTRVLLALPSASRRRKRKILERLVEVPVHVQTVPEIADIVAGRARVDDIREVEVEDLLGREEVPPDPDLLTACVAGKVVMVTGAGGSIGSELCRQILKLKPAILLLYEISEIALYQIDRQLNLIKRELTLPTQIVPLLGSVHHGGKVRETMSSFGVQTVYHAAAYKHVPIVEQNVIEGVHNNVFGTLHTAKAALETGVETFVLVSTDKAVSPTNVMGATKRFAEMLLQALNEENTETRFCMVRFGNVLASSGSVVPLFKEQIRSGGPVTVTHPEIIRYFMTIPEAAQLVIQAGSMAKGGDVFVLDMGKPVKILDLARRMIHLMGLTVRDEENPEGDIEIRFTGLRPAEKLYEELLIGSDVSGTDHQRILRANEEYLQSAQLDPMVDDLWQASREMNVKMARDVLLKAVSGYKPTTEEIEDLIWERKQKSPLHSKKNVTSLF